MASGDKSQTYSLVSLVGWWLFAKLAKYYWSLKKKKKKEKENKQKLSLFVF